MEQKPEEVKGWGYSFFHFIREKFDLNDDRALQSEVVENISKGVEFKGTNLWVLIFATFVASLGLNVNSAAVIIGAMLISPLMGPIMGIGLSLGINNFELMKRSLRNFGFMVAVSILTSTLYFMISPLSNAQSELLARTVPTTYDVLIAFFGGLAGFVAQTRKDRTSTVISGVAIATALMPPLCTAGFGLATGQFTYFIGAFYLFFINTVFIAMATYIIVRFMKYDKKVFLDKQRERRVKRYMIVIMLVTFVPSVVLGYRIVQRTVFETNADKYVTSVFNFNKTQVIDYSRTYAADGKNSSIDVLLVGDALDNDVIDNMKTQMLAYGLKNTELVVRQASQTDKIDVRSMQVSYAQILDEKNNQISDMKRRIHSFTMDTLAHGDISREAGVVVDNIEALSLSKQVKYNTLGVSIDTMLVCIVRVRDTDKSIDSHRLREWLKQRTKSNEVKLYIERKDAEL